VKQKERDAMLVVFDCETTGKAKDWNASYLVLENWPRLVELAWAKIGKVPLSLADVTARIVKPAGFQIPAEATVVHGITTRQAAAEGEDLVEVLMEFCRTVVAADAIVGHNVRFDVCVVAAELVRCKQSTWARLLTDKPVVDTMLASTELCRLPGKYGSFKYPRLGELHSHLFGWQPENAHRASGDVLTTAKCFRELVERGVIAKDY